MSETNAVNSTDLLYLLDVRLRQKLASLKGEDGNEDYVGGLIDAYNNVLRAISLEQVKEIPISPYLAFCEGCKDVATGEDQMGVPLCQKCADSVLYNDQGEATPPEPR